MKIVYVYDAIARIGGVERVFVDKMNYLADKHEYDIYLITAAQGSHPLSFPLSSEVKHIDIDVRFHLLYQYSYPKRLWVKWKLNYKFRKNFNAQIKKIDPDIIIGASWYNADIICKLKCRAKKIIESHSVKSHTGLNDGIKRNACIQWIYTKQHEKYQKIIEEQSDAIVALTQEDANEWKNAKCVYVIPNMINFIPEQSSSCEIPRVISAGRLTYAKGFNKLIEAWHIVHQKHPNWKLDIFGTGELDKELNEQIIETGLQQSVTINPPTPYILNEFQKSSFYVMSSQFEGFAMVLIEAMSCGIPCISFNCPYGPQNIIQSSIDGMLIKHNDTKELSNAICYLIENEQVRKEYGRKAKENVKRFLPEYIMPQWINLFETLIKA